MEKSACFYIGYIARTRGVKGEIVLCLDVDVPQRYVGIDAVLIAIDGTLKPFAIEKSFLQHNSELVLKPENISSPEEAALLKGHEVYLPLSVLPPLDDRHFYFHEIKNFRVVDEFFGEVGIAADVLERTVQPVLRVLRGKHEILIPLAAGVVKKIDRAAKELHIVAPPGLIEIYLAGDNE